MGLYLFPFKIYEVVNGSEVYKWDQDFFMKISDYETYASTTDQGTCVGVTLVTDGGGVSMFYVGASPLPYPDKYMGFTNVHLVNMTAYIGNLNVTRKFRFHLKSKDGHDRAFDAEFTATLADTDDKRISLIFKNLYLDGRTIYNNILKFLKFPLKEKCKQILIISNLQSCYYFPRTFCGQI